EPDGYTLLAAQPAPLTTNVVMYKKLSFDPAAFEPLAIMTSIPNTLTVRLDFPAASVPHLIAYAQANPRNLTSADHTPAHPAPTLFPYTTLFRSRARRLHLARGAAGAADHQRRYVQETQLRPGRL